MELSHAAHEALWAVVDNDPADAPASSTRRGGQWHCPADGTRMNESRGQVCCPACGRYLPHSLLYQLIEFHTHRTVHSAEETHDSG